MDHFEENELKNPPVAGIPKADLHTHAKTRARMDHLVSRRGGEAAHDWGEEVRGLADVPPGMERIESAFSVL